MSVVAETRLGGLDKYLPRQGLVDPDRVRGTVGAGGDQPDGDPRRHLTDGTQKVNEQAASALADAGWEPSIYIVSILIAAAIFFGFLPRLNEYRYRPR